MTTQSLFSARSLAGGTTCPVELVFHTGLIKHTGSASPSVRFGLSALCARRLGNVMPEEGFDPGPDEEDYIPWDCDKD